MYYKLDQNRNVVPASAQEANDILGSLDRVVARTKLPLNSGDEVEVSTVFLCIDHAWGDGEPVVFETMIFGGADEYQWRYCTFKEAAAAHTDLRLHQDVRRGAEIR